MSRCCEYILLNKTPVKCMECFFTHSFTVSQFVLVKELENKLLFWHHYSLDLNHLNHTIMVTEQLTVILFGSKHLIGWCNTADFNVCSSQKADFNVCSSQKADFNVFGPNSWFPRNLVLNSRLQRYYIYLFEEQGTT